MKHLPTTVAFFLLFALSGAVAADSAEDIMEASGVRGGLIVNLDCAGGELTAAIAASDCSGSTEGERTQEHLARDRTGIRRFRPWVELNKGAKSVIESTRYSG